MCFAQFECCLVGVQCEPALARILRRIPCVSFTSCVLRRTSHADTCFAPQTHQLPRYRSAWSNLRHLVELKLLCQPVLRIVYCIFVSYFIFMPLLAFCLKEIEDVCSAGATLHLLCARVSLFIMTFQGEPVSDRASQMHWRGVPGVRGGGKPAAAAAATPPVILPARLPPIRYSRLVVSLTCLLVTGFGHAPVSRVTGFGHAPVSRVTGFGHAPLLRCFVAIKLASVSRTTSASI